MLSRCLLNNKNKLVCQERQEKSGRIFTLDIRAFIAISAFYLGTWFRVHHGLLYHLKKQSALTENTSIKTNCSLFTLIIFSEHSYFLRKSQITPERKQRKKIFFNSICTPLEHPDSPQSLYLWAFSQFSPLLKLDNY